MYEPHYNHSTSDDLKQVSLRHTHGCREKSWGDAGDQRSSDRGIRCKRGQHCQCVRGLQLCGEHTRFVKLYLHSIQETISKKLHSHQGAIQRRGTLTRLSQRKCEHRLLLSSKGRVICGKTIPQSGRLKLVLSQICAQICIQQRCGKCVLGSRVSTV